MKPVLKSIILPALTASVFCMTPLITDAATKPLTNADVIAMIKAGLPENTIILSIQQAAAKFDTAPQSLILLKKQGVSAKVLDTMLNKQQGTASPGKSFKIATANTELTGVRVLIDGQPVLMKRSKAQSRFSSGWLSLVTSFSDSKGRTVLEGISSKLRLKSTDLAFEVALPEDVDPEDYVTLVRLEVKADRRQIETSRVGFSISDGARSKDGFPKDRVIPITMEDTGAKTPSGNTIYRVKVANSLTPGEYSIVRSSTIDSAEEEASDKKKSHSSANYYDFGVDTSS
jgi:hypothetical protein